MMIPLNFFRTRAARVLAGATFIFAATGSLFAVPTLSFVYNGVTTTVADQSAQDSNAFVGDITFNGAVGGWKVVATGTTLGTPGVPSMDLDFVATTNIINAKPLTISFTEGGFTNTNDWVTTFMGGTQHEGKVVFTSSVNGGSPFTSNTFNHPAGGYSGSGGPVLIHPATNYNITLKAVITPGTVKNWVASADYEMDSTPEPGFYSLTGLGLAGLAAVAIRRKRKAVA